MNGINKASIRLKKPFLTNFKLQKGNINNVCIIVILLQLSYPSISDFTTKIINETNELKTMPRRIRYVAENQFYKFIA